VHAGQLLVALENRDLSAAVQESKGTLEQAEAGYATATGATIPEDMRKAQLDVAQAQQNLTAQERILNSRKSLFEEGALPRKDLDAEQVAYVQAKATYDLAEQHLESLQRVSQEAAKKTAQAQLVAAKGHYAGAEAQLQFSEIRSPINGVVTERNWFAGETPTAGSTLVTVMDLSQIIAKAHVQQAAAQLMKVGDAADVTPSGADKPVGGKVTLISPALDPNSTTVEVWVTLNNPKDQIRPGGGAKLDIVTRRAKQALSVPKQAIVQSEKGPTVMLVGSDQVAHTQPVVTGITDNEQGLVQITSGLKPGDPIVGSIAYGLPDGTKVKAAESTSNQKPEAGQAKEDKD
jgi:HlyD family secretion protein